MNHPVRPVREGQELLSQALDVVLDREALRPATAADHMLVDLTVLAYHNAA